VSTVTAASDKVIRVLQSSGVWLLDIEAQSSYDADKPAAMLLTSVVLNRRHQSK